MRFLLLTFSCLLLGRTATCQPLDSKCGQVCGSNDRSCEPGLDCKDGVCACVGLDQSCVYGQCQDTTAKCLERGLKCIPSGPAFGVDVYDNIKLCCEGSVCKQEGDVDPIYAVYSCQEVSAKRVATPPPTCREEGDRCIGASGYPRVEWIPCCEGHECSAKDTSDGGYGLLCSPKYPSPSPSPVLPTVSSSPASAGKSPYPSTSLSKPECGYSDEEV